MTNPPFVNAVFGVLNLIFAICAAAIIEGSEIITFAGVMAYMVWFGIAIYAIALAVWALLKMLDEKGMIDLPKIQKNEKKEKPEKKANIKKESQELVIKEEKPTKTKLKEEKQPRLNHKKKKLNQRSQRPNLPCKTVK